MRQLRNIFLADALGAAMSALLMVLLIAAHPVWFGLPRNTALGLSIPAVLLAAYSGGCYLFRPPNWRPHLRRIVMGNLLYLAAILTLLASRRMLTSLGTLYFAGECAVIAAIVILELRTLRIHADT